MPGCVFLGGRKFKALFCDCGYGFDFPKAMSIQGAYFAYASGKFRAFGALGCDGIRFLSAYMKAKFEHKRVPPQAVIYSINR